jgi:hypothetical protein
MKRLRLFFYELNYKSHLAIRFLHDHLYSKDGLYKKYSDRGYVRAIRHAILCAFFLSVFVFFVLELNKI